MSSTSKIEWTDATWNPVVGCSRVSPGCDHCYAIRQAVRIQAMQEALGNKTPYEGTTRQRKDGSYDWTGVVNAVPDRFDQPIRWKRPRMIFVNSMSDLFHPALPADAVDAVMLAIYAAPRHVFQVLTKRPDRMARYLSRPPAPLGFELAQAALRMGWTDFKPTIVESWPPPNVWFGTSVENQETANERIPWLLQCPGSVRWLSMEPLLGPVDLTQVWARMPSGGQSLMDALRPADVRIDWVVAGGESGPRARPMHPDWVRQVRDQCAGAGVAFHFKQWGEHLPQSQTPPDPRQFGPLVKDATGYVYFRMGKHKAGRILDGRTWDEYPPAVPA